MNRVNRNNPFFSILVPVYNQEQYLPECLRAIRNQTFSDYEVILVDDGSTDGSGKLCDAFAAECPDRVKVIHQINRGLILARKAALLEASGEYMVFCDSDDWLVEGALESMHRALYDRDGSLYDAVFYNAFSDEKRNCFFALSYETGTVFTGEGLSQLYELLGGSNSYNSIWSKCFRRSLFDIAVMYADAEKINMGEDTYQVLPLLDRVSCVVYLDEPLYFYRPNPASMTHKWKSVYFESMQLVMQRRILYAKKWNVDTVLLQQAIADNCYFCVNNLFWSEASVREQTVWLKQIVQDDIYRKYHKYHFPKLSKKMKALLVLADMNACMALFLNKWLMGLRKKI